MTREEIEQKAKEYSDIVCGYKTDDLRHADIKYAYLNGVELGKELNGTEELKKKIRRYEEMINSMIAAGQTIAQYKEKFDKLRGVE